MTDTVSTTALHALAHGISVVPIRADGTKHPALSTWRAYQQRQATAAECRRWFSGASCGIAFVTGAVSDRLEAVDFDDLATFTAWEQRLLRSPALAALWQHVSLGYLEATPSGGRHVLYRCDQIEGNQRLASRQGHARRTTLIETRGEGGLLIVAPSRGGVHPSGKPYVLLHGGIASIRSITAQQRRLLLAALRECDELPVQRPLFALPARSAQAHRLDGTRPGDLLNQRASWHDLLEPEGWHLMSMCGEEGYWRRPGKVGPGISATTNYGGSDLLYVFSTSTVFEAGRAYSKFQAYTLLHHHGNFAAAARALVQQSSLMPEKVY